MKRLLLVLFGKGAARHNVFDIPFILVVPSHVPYKLRFNMRAKMRGRACNRLPFFSAGKHPLQFVLHLVFVR